MEKQRFDGPIDADSALLFLRELKEDLDKPPDLKINGHQAFEEMWAILAGSHLEEILSDIAMAKKHLLHQSWRVRFAAVSILRRKWKQHENLAPIFERMAFEDIHPQVRGAALFSLACCFEGENDSRIGKLLASIVNDDHFPCQYRQIAYEGLFRLRGMPSIDSPIPGKYRFPEDVDWRLVRSFHGAISSHE